jgi:hypothetical protein
METTSKTLDLEAEAESPETPDVPIRVYSRQIGLFNPYDKSNQVPVVVVGAGTIGSWTTLFLAKIGIEQITVFDEDAVEIQNIANQVYGPFQHGQKWWELSKQIELMTGYQIKGFNIQFPPGDFVDVSGGIPIPSLESSLLPSGQFILIVTVDSMKSRKAIFEWLKVNFYKVRFFIDARTGGEVGRVFAFNPTIASNHDKYLDTLHDDTPDEAMSEELRAASNVKCTERSIVDVSVTVASRIVNSVRKYITKKEVPFETDIDLRNDIWLTMK